MKTRTKTTIINIQRILKIVFKKRFMADLYAARECLTM
jgi:hypothetical protein